MMNDAKQIRSNVDDARKLPSFLFALHTGHVNFDSFLRLGLVIIPADHWCFINREDRHHEWRKKEYKHSERWRVVTLPYGWTTSSNGRDSSGCKSQE